MIRRLFVFLLLTFAFMLIVGFKTDTYAKNVVINGTINKHKTDSVSEPQFTNSQSVKVLLIYSHNIRYYKLSNDFSLNGADWERVNNGRGYMYKKWTLSPGNGNKTVYAAFMDKRGNVYYENSADGTPFNDEIILNGSSMAGSVLINGGDSVTYDRYVNLTFSSTYASQMMVWEEGTYYIQAWIPYSQTMAWTLSSGDGEKKINVRFMDSAGNLSPVYSDNITLITQVKPNMPVLSLDSRDYYGPQTLTMSAEHDAVIYYTLDGTEPNSYSQRYYSSIPINYSTTVKAKAYKNGVFSDTKVVRISIINWSYPPYQVLNPPTASLPSGVYNQMLYLTLTAEPGASIRYTMDGSEPNENSIPFKDSIYVITNMTIKAKAFRYGYASSTASYYYVINQYPHYYYPYSYQDTNYTYAHAKELYDSGKYDEALKIINKVLEKDSSHDAVDLLVKIYIKKGDFVAAKNRLTSYTNVTEYPKIINDFARECIDKGLNNLAYEIITDTVLNYPNEIYLYETMAAAEEKMYFKGTQVFVYGKEVEFSKYDNVTPKIIEGRTLIPIRALSEALGADVEWNAASRKAFIYLNGNVIELTDKSKNANVNGARVILDVPARIMGDRLMIPIRFISENFGKKVNWYMVQNKVGIISVTEK